MNNIKIKIIEGKDIINNRIPKKYKGALDWSQEVDYILNDDELKEMIYSKQEVSEVYEVFDTEVDVLDDGSIELVDILEEHNEYIDLYSDDIITVKFKCNLVKELDGFQEFAKKEIEEFEKLKTKKATYKEIRGKEKEIEGLKRTYIKCYKENEISNTNKEIEKLKENIEIIKDKYRNGEREVKVNANKNKLSKEDYEEVKRIKLKIEDCKKIIKEINNKRVEAILKPSKLRLDSYEKDFELNGIKYKRYKRSSGSARVGKVLYVNEKYYDKLIKWSFCSIPISGKHDIAALEAYISLPLSSAINKFELEPKNILLVEDIKSIFTDTVYATEATNIKYKKDENGEDTEEIETAETKTEKKKIEISNNISDGESILDNSVFGNLSYVDKASVQIRQKWYKGIGVRCNIQLFFEWIGVTKVSELNGITLAKDIHDIKLITTPSSLKFMKMKSNFNNAEECFKHWLNQISNEWYVCKYEKAQNHFNSMVQTHYQLNNTLGMSEKSFREFLKPSIDYIEKLKNDDDVFIKHIKIKNNDIANEIDDEIEKDKNYILTMLKLNRNFIHTAAFKNFRKKAIQSYINNIKSGHVLIEGNYSVVVNNILELLFHSVGRVKEGGERGLYIEYKSDIKLEGYEVISNKFEDGEEILSVRSPQPSMSNISVYTNVKNNNNYYYNLMDMFFYLNSNEVIYTNSINVNRMEKASSEDFDGDAEMITNNKILVEHAKNLQSEFLVNNDLTPKKLELKEYTGENLAKLDIDTSVNKIGEIINLAQSLNSAYWKGVKENKDKEWLEGLYKTICTLNTLSCIEIDRAKKISPISATKEINKIRKTIKKERYLEIAIEEVKINKDGTKKEHQLKPAFLKYCNEFKTNKDDKDNKKPYEFTYYDYGVGMDLLIKVLEEEINKIVTIRKHRVSMVELLNKGAIDKKKENRRQVNATLDKIDEAIMEINSIWATGDETEDKLKQVEEVDFGTVKSIIKKVTPYNIARIIYYCEKYVESKEVIGKSKKAIEKINDKLKNELTEKIRKEYEDSKAEYVKTIKKCEEFINNPKHKSCKYYATILRILFKTNTKDFLSVFKVETTVNTLKRVNTSVDDCITLYGVNYIKQAS